MAENDSRSNLIDHRLQPLEIDNNQSPDEEQKAAHDSGIQKQGSVVLNCHISILIDVPEQVGDVKVEKNNYFMGALMMFM